METTSKPEAKITLDELTKTVEFRVLPRRHAEWTLLYVKSFLETGIFDQRAATEAVYRHAKADPENLRTYGYFLRQHPKIQAAVRKVINTGKSPLELQLEATEREIRDIERHLAASDAGSTAAPKLLSLRREAWEKRDALSEQIAKGVQVAPKPEAAPHRYNVGDIFTQDGVQYQTTSVDTKGQPLTADEVK
jgi:hypothetical protein